MSTITPIDSDFIKQALQAFLDAVEKGTLQAYRMYWDIFMSMLAEHWPLILLLLFVLFTAATVKALAGRWGALGSLLYNTFYFGTLFVIGLIWGPEVYAGDLFKATCTVLLYPICFYASGWVLKKTGLRKPYR